MHPGLRFVIVASCGTACANSGVVAGAQDSHCSGQTPEPVSVFTCPTSGSGGSVDYGATLYNNTGDDDDCKYHVKWSATNVAENTDVTFTLVATWRADGTPVTGAETRIEAFLNDTHPAPNSHQTTTEKPSGTYVIGPVRFDAKGQWITRYHLFGDCDDSSTSKHGHAAFYVKVP